MDDIDKSSKTYKRLREIWRSCYKRCEGKGRCKDYEKYGARGIRMCPEWRNDFMTFYNWAMTHGYRNDLTLERVSVNRGYNPGNCIWVSRKAQAYNRRTNTRYTIDGHTKTLQEWSEQYGVPPDVILHRLEDGWGLGEAVKTPRKRSCRKRHTEAWDASDTLGGCVDSEERDST